MRLTYEELQNLLMEDIIKECGEHFLSIGIADKEGNFYTSKKVSDRSNENYYDKNPKEALIKLYLSINE